MDETEARSLVKRTKRAAQSHGKTFPWAKLAHLLATKNFEAGATLIRVGDRAEQDNHGSRPTEEQPRVDRDAGARQNGSADQRGRAVNEAVGGVR